jgi:nucleoside-diphosphate-sugar epimerase
VRDVVKATLLAINQNAAGEILNVGTGHATSIKNLCEMFLKTSNKTHLMPIHAPPRAGEIKHSFADIKKTKTILGFEPTVVIEEGVKEFWGL